MEYGFGSGTLVAVPSGSNPTPVPFGVVQDVQVDFTFSLKELIGQYQAPVAIARAALKTDIKVKLARIYSAMFNSAFFGQSVTANSGIAQQVSVNDTVPASSPYTVTVANSSTWTADLGVFYAATGVQLTRVASSPAQGQYSVAAGVYTFASADASAGVLINYLYTLSTGASKIVIANQLQGSGPTFQMNLAETFNGKICNLQLNSCIAGKLSLPFKNQDFTMIDWEAQAMADASNNIGVITVSE